MRTNYVPAIVTLLAGGVYCVLSIVFHKNSEFFLKDLLLVLVIFFIIGCVIKIILDKGITMMADVEPEEEEEVEELVVDAEDNLENIDATDAEE